MRGAVHHIDLTVIDLATSTLFYDKVLGFLGYRKTRRRCRLELGTPRQ
jgi:glyoxylase I family protein